MARCCSVENKEELPYIVHPLKPISPSIFFHINVGTSNVPIYSRVHKKFMHDKDIAVIDRFQHDISMSVGGTFSAISPVRPITQGNLRQTASHGSQLSGASTASIFSYTTDTAIRSKQLAFPHYKYCRVVKVASSNASIRGFAPSFADHALQDEFTSSSMSRFYSTDIRQPGNQQLPLIDFWIGAKPENQHILLYQPDQEGYLCLVARLQPHIQRFVKLTRYYQNFHGDLILPAVNPVDIETNISLRHDNVLDSIAIANSTKKPVFFPAQASRIILFKWLWQYNDTVLSLLPWELIAYILDFVLTNKRYLEIAVQYTRRELEMYYDINL